MRIWITGIAGMIGYHTANTLVEKGHTVQGIDNFNDYYDVDLKRARAKILERKGVVVHTKDLVDLQKNDESLIFNERGKDDINEFPTWTIHRPDVILHLAAYANPRHALAEPQPYIDTNITGTQRLIEMVEDLNTSLYITPGKEAAHTVPIPVVYASSSCVMHGQPLPWNEHDRPGHQNNPYGWSKRANECQFMHSKIVRSAGLRFFTVYGPYGRPDMALFKFTDQIVKGEPLTLYNYGNMKRDFTYVQDIVNGIELVLQKVVDDAEDKYHEIYNIGYGEQVDLMEFVDEIEKNLGRTAERELVPPHPADVPETWSDTTKLQQLGYKPTTSIQDGVAEFVSWYKHYYGVN